MQLLSVALGSVAAVAIPALLVLYFLKRRYEIAPVPSTKLWREALSTLHADKPWQRLRTSLLFFLQLAAILLLVFAAFRPVTGANLPSEMVVVIDCSGSMQAKDVSPTRFEKARAEAQRIIDALPQGGRFTLIAARKQPEIVISRVADRIQAKRALDALKPENGNAAMDEALQLAAALKRETGAGIAVLSDQYKDAPAIWCGGDGANRAIETLTTSRVNGQLQALTVIRSHGYTGTVTAECRADGKLVDAREVNLPLNETAVIYWTSLPQNAKRLNVKLTGSDALALDDEANCIITSNKTLKALLVADKNVFLEAVLKLREDVELYKQAPGEAETLKGYDLYIFDGTVPKKLPTDGSILVFNPNGEVSGLVPANGDGGTLAPAMSSATASLLQNVDISKVQLAKNQTFTLTSGWQPLAWLGSKPVIATAEMAGRRMAVFGFDLHDSNLPLLKDFPILMQNLLSWELSDATGGVSEVKAGGSVPLLAYTLAAKINVVTPSGRVIQAAPPFPAVSFEQTDELGVYEVRQYGNDGKELTAALSSFAVNASTATESDLQAVSALPQLSGGGGNGVQAAASVNWWLFAAIAAFLLVLAEWLVNRYGR
jgi:Ca-activated chloride channel homolog